MNQIRCGNLGRASSDSLRVLILFLAPNIVWSRLVVVIEQETLGFVWYVVISPEYTPLTTIIVITIIISLR